MLRTLLDMDSAVLPSNRESNMTTTFTLYAAPTSQADVPMGEDYESIDAARAALPAMMSEWDEQCGGEDDVRATDCRWYVWDNSTRQTVEVLHG